jgi:hypothetical protein
MCHVAMQGSSAAIDYTMPRDTRLERKAFTQVVGFSDICRAQDEIAKQDDVQREANKKAFFCRTRAMLDAQMAEEQQQRVRATHLATHAWCSVVR